MGLAVTNTRDEPTGAIPNFRKAPSADGGSGELLTKLLGVQIAFSLLTPVLGEVTGEQDKMAAVTKIASAAMMGLTVATLLGSKGLGRIGNFFSNTINPFAGVGKKGMVKGAALMKGTPAVNVPASSLTGPGFTRAGKAARPITGGALRAGSALLRFAGPVGIAAGVVTAFVMTVNAASGANKSLKIAQDALSESTKTAAKELGELQIPEEFKQERQESAKRLAENSANELRFSGVDIKGFKDNKQIEA